MHICRAKMLKCESSELRKPYSCAKWYGTMALFSLIIFPSMVFAFNDSDIASFQKQVSGKPIGERIALWAEKFVGTPYDPDPLGEYVRRNVIVADDRVDCMYHSFRTLELAMSNTPEEAIRVALDKRFMERGILESEVVVNYNDRFQYGEDMLDSGKWGKEITGEIGSVTHIQGSRGRTKVGLVSKNNLINNFNKKLQVIVKDGDFIFFVKSPEKRVANEIVGHIGIIKWEGNDIYLIHASGRKNNGGEVRKVLFLDYVGTMPFAGVRVSRFP
jgi:hypothetical protein